MTRNDSAGFAGRLSDILAQNDQSIMARLTSFVDGASNSQQRAWMDELKWLRRAAQYLINQTPLASTWGIVLEYLVPMELRRIDAVILTPSRTLILEFKQASVPTVAAVDQALGYARDLSHYHRDCHSIPAWPILILTDCQVPRVDREMLTICPGSDLANVLIEYAGEPKELDRGAVARFISDDAYAPLPNLVSAARALFAREPLPAIKRAAAATDPSVKTIAEIAHRCANERRRALVLVTGVPGAGKTLVGLRTAHADYLDDLAISRDTGAASSPAVFLSGNGPLVKVLQDALKRCGSDGKTFVRDVKAYVRKYSHPRSPVPPEHVLIYDEAQRAWDAQQVETKHKGGLLEQAFSEPVLFVHFAERIPQWSVIVGLIGTGQEIHVGEEGGITQWKDAICALSEPSSWDVYAPPAVAKIFKKTSANIYEKSSLSLNTELRFHASQDFHQWVAYVLADDMDTDIQKLAKRISESGTRLYVTRDLCLACDYTRERYSGMPTHRFGMLASSKDKDLIKYGVDNDFHTTKSLRVTAWYNANPDDPKSCCQLDAVATEFAAQGLELDFAVVAWGSDFIRSRNCWDSSRKRGTRGHVRNPHELRRNSYRVLLTRGRDGFVAYLPDKPLWNETYNHLRRCGMYDLEVAREKVAKLTEVVPNFRAG